MAPRALIMRTRRRGSQRVSLLLRLAARRDSLLQANPLRLQQRRGDLPKQAKLLDQRRAKMTSILREALSRVKLLRPAIESS